MLPFESVNATIRISQCYSQVRKLFSTSDEADKVARVVGNQLTTSDVDTHTHTHTHTHTDVKAVKTKCVVGKQSNTCL